MTDTQLFTFERLDVFRAAEEALRVVIKYRARLRGLPGQIAGQLERAAVSTICNITEAAGRNTPGERRSRLSIARGEANEAGAMARIAQLFHVFSDEDYATLRSTLLRVTWMLTAMMK